MAIPNDRKMSHYSDLSSYFQCTVPKCFFAEHILKLIVESLFIQVTNLLEHPSHHSSQRSMPPSTAECTPIEISGVQPMGKEETLRHEFLLHK